MPIGYIKSPPGTPRDSIDNFSLELAPSEPPSAWSHHGHAGPSRSRSSSVTSQRASVVSRPPTRNSMLYQSQSSCHESGTMSTEPPSAWIGSPSHSHSRPASALSHRQSLSRASVGASMTTHDTHSTRPGSASLRKSIDTVPRRRSSIVYGSRDGHAQPRAPSRAESLKTGMTSNSASSASAANGLHFNPGVAGVGFGVGRRPLAPRAADPTSHANSPYSFLYNHSREFAHLHANSTDDQSTEALLKAQNNVIDEVRLGRLAHYVQTSQKLHGIDKRRATSRASSRLSTGSLALSRTSTAESGLRRLSMSPSSAAGSPRPLSLSLSPVRRGQHARRLSDPALARSPVSSIARSSVLSVDTIATEEIEMGINQRLGIPTQPSAPPISSSIGTPSTPGRSTPTPHSSPSSQQSLPISPDSQSIARTRMASLDVAIRPLSGASYTPPQSTYSISSAFSGDSYDLAQSQYYDAKFKREHEPSNESERRETRHRRVLALAETMRLLDGSSSRASQLIDDDTAHLGFLAALGGSVSIGGSLSDDNGTARGHRRRLTLVTDDRHSAHPSTIAERPETMEHHRQAASLDLSPKRKKPVARDLWRVAATQQPLGIRNSDSSMESVSSSLIAAGNELMTAKPWLNGGVGGAATATAVRREHSATESDSSQRTARSVRSVRSVTTDFDGAFVATSAWHGGATDGVVNMATSEWPGFGFGEEEGLGSVPVPRQKTISRVSFDQRAGKRPAAVATDKKARRITYSARLWSRTSQSIRSTPSSQTQELGMDKGFWKSLGVSSVHWRQSRAASTLASSSPYNDAAVHPVDDCTANVPDLSFESSPSNFSQAMPASPAPNGPAVFFEPELAVPDFVADLDTTSPLSTPAHSTPGSPSPMSPIRELPEPDANFVANLDTAFETAFAQHVAMHIAAQSTTGRTTPFDAYSRQHSVIIPPPPLGSSTTRPKSSTGRSPSRISKRFSAFSRLSKTGGGKLDKSKTAVKKGLAWCARLIRAPA